MSWLTRFGPRRCRNAAQLVCGLLLLLRAEPAECDQALWLFVVVEGGVAAVNVLVFGVAEWCIVAGADGDYLEAFVAPAACWWPEVDGDTNPCPAMQAPCPVRVASPQHTEYRPGRRDGLARARRDVDSRGRSLCAWTCVPRPVRWRPHRSQGPSQDESLLLLSRVVVAVGWLVMLFQCCCLVRPARTVGTRWDRISHGPCCTAASPPPALRHGRHGGRGGGRPRDPTPFLPRPLLARRRVGDHARRQATRGRRQTPQANRAAPGHQVRAARRRSAARSRGGQRQLGVIAGAGGGGGAVSGALSHFRGVLHSQSTPGASSHLQRTKRTPM